MSTMNAIIHTQYGPPAEALAYTQVEVPTPAVDQLLVRVRASAINPGDLFVVQGVPAMLRLVNGVTSPKHPVPGLVVAGTVESAGVAVTRLQPGDRVYAEISRGAFAEYACVPEKVAALMPAAPSFEEAAAIPLVGVTALQALRDKAKVQPGQRVLVTGASGGVGSLAVQVAVALGAEVTGVCSTGNVELVRSLGAHHVIDYTTDDLTRSRQQWDVVLDNVAALSLGQLRRLVVPGGVLLPSANTDGRWLGGASRAAGALALTPFVRQRLRPFVALPKADDLATLTEMVDAGTLRPVVDSVYPLSKTVEALEHYATRHARGKVVLSV
jgi:NADPH:quinone reductase-like Zn-dependent oxidoreductase